tara:strand:+ start:562 stop:768 length:207 start_codon:yes stop_codon:yes gene_type:complete
MEIIFNNDADIAEKTFTINERDVVTIFDALLELEAKVNNGLLSPRATAKKIHLINDLFCDTVNNKLNK